MPIILYISLYLVRLIKKTPRYELNWIQIISMTTFYALLFEYILPLQSAEYTADLYDVVFYFIGAIFYALLFQNKVQLAEQTCI
jgi:hypothetical protein